MMLRLFIAGSIVGGMIGAIIFGYVEPLALALIAVWFAITVGLFIFGIFYVLRNPHKFHGYD